MRVQKKILCIGLALSLLVGCSPVIFNGNLNFQAYDPPPYYGTNMSNAVEEVVLDYDSYNIEGTDALYFLPFHGNSPKEVYDVLVYDFNSDGNFIYAYVADYYGPAATMKATYLEEENPGLTTAKSGIAPAAVEKSAEMLNSAISTQIMLENPTYYETEDRGRVLYDGSASEIVVTIMSFNPKTRAYNVFHTELHPLDSITTAVSAEESGLKDAISVTTVENSISGHKLMDREEYFISIGNRGYQFDKDGNKITESNYIATGKSALIDAGISAEGKEIEIIDVVMDGTGYAHIAMTVTDESEIEVDDGVLDIEDEDTESEEEPVEEPEVGEYLLGMYHLVLSSDPTYANPSERNMSFSFRSTNVAVEAQLEAWSSIDGMTYESKAALDQAAANHSAKNITSGTANAAIGDTWSLFSYGNWTLGYLSLNESKFMSILNAKSHKSSLDEYLYELWEEKGWVEAFNTRSEYYWLWTDDFYKVVKPQSGSYLDYNSLIDYYIAESRFEAVALSPLLPTTSILSRDSGMVYAASATNPNTGSQRVYPLTIDLYYMASNKLIGSVSTDLIGQGISIIPTAYSESVTRTLYYEEEVTTEEGVETRTHSVVEVFEPRITEYSIGVPQTVYNAMGRRLEMKLEWMDLQQNSAYALPSRELGVFYYGESQPANAISGAVGATFIRYNDGTDTRVDDTNIPGTPVEAQLFYTDTREILTVLTNQGVQYYGRIIGDRVVHNFTKGSFVSLDSYNPNSNNLYVAETELSEEEREDYGGDGSALRSLSQFALLNDNEMLVTSQANGLILHNLDSSIFFELEKGSYYNSFPIPNQNGNFMVLGFDTTNYVYSDADLVWAKFYEKDIDAASTAVREELVISYIQSLSNLYWQHTHNLGWDNSGTLSVLSTTEAQKEVIARAENLFFKDESTLTNELRLILAECGQRTETENILVAVAELRREMVNRVAGVKTLFDLAGIIRTPLQTSDPNLLQLEYEMLYANYTYRLESLLVEAYLRQLVGLEKDYEQLGSQLDQALEEGSAIPEEAWDLLEELEAEILSSGADNITLDDDFSSYYDRETTFEEYQGENLKYLYLLMQLSFVHDSANSGWSGAMTVEQERLALISASQSDGYTDILDILAARLPEGTDWDLYLAELLHKVNPYNALGTAMVAVEELCDLVEIETTLSTEILEKMTSIYDIMELESLIIEYNITKTKYQGSVEASEWEIYQTTSFSTMRDREAFFYASAFYDIVVDYDNAYELDKPEGAISWDSKLRAIILACSGLSLLDTQLS